MTKSLKALSMERCIGCDLCMLACVFAKLKKLGTNDSFLRIVKKNGKFEAQIDKGKCDACGECVKVCPRNCLEVVGT